VAEDNDLVSEPTPLTRTAALVLGASGFIGTRLVAFLVAQGRAVRAVDLVPPRRKLAGVVYETLDVREPLPVALGQDISVIYNLAAVHRTPGHPREAYYETNVLGALNITQLADDAAVPTILFTSSISVYGSSENLLTETSPLQPSSDYGRSKLMAERVHESWRKAGRDRRLVVVRPGVVFGPGERGNYTNLAGALRRGVFVYPGRKDAIKSGGSVDELLRTFDFALSRPEPHVLYNFAYPQLSTTEDIVTAFGAVTGKRARPPVAPTSVMLAAAAGFEAANRLGLKNPIHRERILKLVNSTKVAPAWLIDSGYRFETDLSAALRAWRDETNGRFV
jgi:nucleoside-diphosphate-sugar epimerase